MALYDEDELDDKDPGEETPENIPSESEDKEAPPVDPEDDPSDEIAQAEEMEKEAVSPDDKAILDEAADDAEANSPSEEEVKEKPKKKEKKDESEEELAKDLEDKVDETAGKREAGGDDELDETQSAPGLAPSGTGVPAGLQTNPTLTKYQQFLDDYKRLQDQRRKGDMVNGLLAAGGKIGQSIAGKYSGQTTPDQNGIRMLEAMNNRPVSDFEQNQVVQSRQMALKDEMDANDPASPQSKLTRDYLNKKLGMNLGEDVSANDAMQLLKVAGKNQAQAHFQKASGYVIGPDGKKKDMTAVFDPSTGQFKDDQGRTVPGFQLQSLNPYQFQKDAHGNINKIDKARGQVMGQAISSAYKPVEDMSPEEKTKFRPDKDQAHAVDAAQKDVNTQTKATREGLEAADRLEKVLKSNNPNQGAVLKTVLPRMMGFNGRMSPLEQNLWSGAQDWGSRFEQAFQTAADGTITVRNKEAALELIREFKQNAKGIMDGAAERAQGSLEMNHSVPREFSSKSIQLPKVTSDKTVVKKGYNAQTNKTQLIYDDGTKEIVDGRQ